MNRQTGSVILRVTPNSVPFSPEVLVNNTPYYLQFGQNLTIDNLPVGYLSLKAKSVTVGDNTYVTKFSPANVKITPGTTVPIAVTFDVLSGTDDLDQDGIINDLEVNGYVWNPYTFEFEAYDPNNSQHAGLEVYRTRPDAKSTSGDPYDDARKASKLNLAHVRPPFDHPSVAAYPIIKANVLEYTVTPIADITDSQGNSISSTFSESVTTVDTQTHGSSFETSYGFAWDSGFEHNFNITTGYSGSRTWGTESTRETGGGEEFNWETAVTYNTSEAADLDFTVTFTNEGSLYAANIIPTFNIILGGKVIFTHSPAIPVAGLGPGETSPIFNIDKIRISLDDLKAIQLGAPIELEMTQVEADIRERNEQGNWVVIGEWPDIYYEIDPKTVTFLYTEQDGTQTEYHVAARPLSGTDYLQTTLGDIFNIVLKNKIQETEDGVYINGILLDDTWIFYFKELDRFTSYLETPDATLKDYPVYTDDIIELREPVASETPLVPYAEFMIDYNKVKASVVPGVYGITKVEAEVMVNGQVQKFPLTANPEGSNFYETEAFPTSADVNFGSRLFVTDGKPNEDGTTGVLYLHDIMGPSDKEGYLYEALSSPQVILSADGVGALIPSGTTNQLKNSNPVTIDLNRLGVKGKTYVFQVESHRWSSNDVSVTIGDQTVQLGCDDWRPNQIEFKYEFKDGRTPVYKLYEGCKMYPFPSMPSDIPEDTVKKITQINSNVYYNGAAFEVYEHPEFDHGYNGVIEHKWSAPNGNIMFDDSTGALYWWLSSFRVMGCTPEKVYDPNVKVRFYDRNNNHYYDQDVNAFVSVYYVADTDWELNDSIEYVELLGDKPVMLLLCSNANYSDDQVQFFLDPYYNVGKQSLWELGRMSSDNTPGGVSSYKIWPVEEYPYLQRGALNSPIVSRTVMVTVPDNASTLPISWNIGGGNNTDYGRVQYKNVAPAGEAERWRTVQTDAHIKVSLIGAFSESETNGKKFTDIATQNIRHTLNIPSGQTSISSSIPLPTEGVNGKATGYLVRVQSVNISSDEVRVNMGNQLCYLGSSDYNLNLDSASGSPGPGGSIPSPVRDELLFVPAGQGASTVNVTATVSKGSRLASSGGLIYVDIIGYFSSTSRLKFIPQGFMSTTNEFTVNNVPYHKVAGHLMRLTINGNYDYRNLLKINGGSTPYAHDVYVGLSNGTTLRDGVKPRNNGKHSISVYSVADNNPVNKVTIAPSTSGQSVTTNYIGYFH
ncbi:binary toxin-like calcium binding domain-containing protein [Bacillus toyonensis]|uniref:binary toxin-like calcium binding domain-containing protein n=1 Tax=Bacillus toyonensis TaxID=155322 RepID=UPI0018A13F47|nr:binary toxin-like calcium binding domain-containing protein [Bacillus toyonensis]MBF7150836.1 hypothetical protein [Bacillus toyonensis]MEC2350960.1 hypothetical protein [Bacillus toyonensis]MED3188825.1 hypothetical protein [Bacillus toyonensis]